MNKANCSDTDPITMKNWIGMKNIAAYTCGDGRAGRGMEQYHFPQHWYIGKIIKFE